MYYFTSVVGIIAFLRLREPVVFESFKSDLRILFFCCKPHAKNRLESFFQDDARHFSVDSTSTNPGDSNYRDFNGRRGGVMDLSIASYIGKEDLVTDNLNSFLTSSLNVELVTQYFQVFRLL